MNFKTQHPLIIFLVVILIYEFLTYYQSVEKTQKILQKIEKQMLYKNDLELIENYLLGILHDKNIQSIHLSVEANKNIVLFSEQNDSWYEAILEAFYLIRTIQIQRDFNINHIKGTLTIFWYNKNFYLYQYLFLFIIILYALFYFYNVSRTHKKQIIDSYNEIKSLKFQQDADYFLTTLLLKPFFAFGSKSESYEIKYYLKQKKEFQHKNKFYQIGGDYIFLKDIIINNQKFIFFINVDAMGKSLQGANGVLILGTILSTFLKRFELNHIKISYPEFFLKNLCLEIQEMFESFEGSMLISGIFGLIDEKRNILYFINFEHPFPIVYRNQKGFFIGEHVLRKLGTPNIFQEEFLVEIFVLKENDVLIIGSDGKEDVEIQKNGIYTINTEKDFFLKIVENSLGNFENIVIQLMNSGTIKDDLSLLYFKNLLVNSDFSIHLEKRLEIIKKTIKKSLYSKNYEDALFYLKEIIMDYYFDNDILLYYLYTLTKLKKYQEAIEFGNILLVRKFDNPLIFNLLLKCYIAENQKTQAREIYKKLKTLYPDQPILIRKEKKTN